MSKNRKHPGAAGAGSPTGGSHSNPPRVSDARPLPQGLPELEIASVRLRAKNEVRASGAHGEELLHLLQGLIYRDGHDVAPLHFFEVVEVRVGRGLWVEDWEDAREGRTWIPHRRASLTYRPGDCFASRVVSGGSIPVYVPLCPQGGRDEDGSS